MFLKKEKEDSGGGIDYEKAQKLLERFGIATKKMSAERVEIQTKDKTIIFEKPDVMITNLMGRDVYNISGEIKERPLLIESDLKKAMKETGKSKEEVSDKLAELNYDINKTIAELKEIKKSDKKKKK